MSAPDFWEEFSEFLGNFDTSRLDNDQDNFNLYMELTRMASWDIPSALPCNHQDREIPMHRPAYDDYDEKNELFVSWKELDKHFKEVHGINLQDKKINWSFDT